MRFERAYKLDNSMLRVAETYARWMSRNKDDERPRASTRPSTRSWRAIRWSWKACATPRPARSCRRWPIRAQAGAAEALYGIGATLTRRGGEDLALVYLQLALYLQPTHPLALLSLADLYESVKRPADGDQGL